MRAMETLYERNNVSNVDVLWREFVTEAQNISQRLKPEDPTQTRLKFYEALGTLRRGNIITDAERTGAEKMMREVLERDPKMEDAWLELLRSQYATVERLNGEQRAADAQAKLVEMEATIAAAKAAVPDSFAWRLASTMLERGREETHDRRADPARTGRPHEVAPDHRRTPERAKQRMA
jgi:hypothetical protein